MVLSIKTAETDELARSLARLTGENMTEVVTVALRERLARARQAPLLFIGDGFGTTDGLVALGPDSA